MKKKVLAMLCCMTMVAASLTGCGGDRGRSSFRQRGYQDCADHDGFY